jgi:hypothetical protein
MEAMMSAEFACIRYRGADPDFLVRMVENGLSDQIDGVRPENASTLNRTHATFLASPSIRNPRDLARDFERRLLAENAERFSPFMTRRGPPFSRDEVLRICWYGRHFHSVFFAGLPGGRWLVRHNRFGDLGRGMSRIIAGWLGADPGFVGVAWLTAEEFNAGHSGQARPY